jgi:hypothetical protein
MRDTMIERVARALCRFEGHLENIPFEGQPMWASYIDQARAVLTAMRDPTEEMREAAASLDLSESPIEVSGPLYFSSMIEAALVGR